MLVVDRSGSMNEPQQKLFDAQQAAKTFVELTDLGQDRIGLVSFASNARVDEPLTQDAGRLNAAIDRLSANGGTNIADGILKADQELAEEEHGLDVLLLLTDGLAKGEEAAALARAEAAKQRGVQVYVVGLGSDVNADLLRAIASTPSNYYFAPTSAELEAVYRTLSEVIPCAAGVAP
jgi:Mg-chelatase subunit ChlD